MARRIAIALAHIFPFALDILHHLALRWQRILAYQVFADPFALQFGERHNCAERLQQANEEQVGILWVKNPAKQEQVVVPGFDNLGLEEGERHFIARAVDNAVCPLPGTIREDYAFSVKALDVRLGLDAAMRYAMEDFRANRRMSMQDRVVGFWQPEIRELADLQPQYLAKQSTLYRPWNEFRNGLLVKWPAENVLWDDVEAAPHRQVGHYRDTRCLNCDIHSGVAKSHDQNVLIYVWTRYFVVVAVNDRTIEMPFKGRLRPARIPMVTVGHQ